MWGRVDHLASPSGKSDIPYHIAIGVSPNRTNIVRIIRFTIIIIICFCSFCKQICTQIPNAELYFFKSYFVSMMRNRIVEFQLSLLLQKKMFTADINYIFFPNNKLQFK